jgi:hypothetical protein
MMDHLESDRIYRDALIGINARDGGSDLVHVSALP